MMNYLNNEIKINEKKLERVIKGLEELRSWLKHLQAVGFLGDISDYRERENTVRNALELLKSQQPRVMTLEEVKQWCETHSYKQNPIWVEFQRGHGTDGWRVDLVNSGLLSWCEDKEARCWTSCPTEAQREAVKWDDP